jgi:colanic acid biosynthesis protein WcaH
LAMKPLTPADLSLVVRLTPLVSIDLVLRNDAQKVLLGLRTNEPAKGTYFVPGGRIWKDERLEDAFGRILKTETGLTLPFSDARFLGVYEHLYETNRFGQPGYGTHYVVLGYEINVGQISQVDGDTQHSHYVWFNEDEIVRAENVHENTKAYFKNDETR